MSYHVEWLEEALAELAEIWLRSDSTVREAITEAGHRIDQRLKRNPLGEGESRSGSKRLTFIYPLAVLFQLEPDGKTVTVLHVRRYGKRAN